MPHLLFVTSSNLTTNPRCLKEIRLAISLQYKVSVIKFTLGNWSHQFEENIENELPQVNFYNISAERKPMHLWLAATVMSVVSRVIFFFFSNSGYLNAIKVDKRSWLIRNTMHKTRIDADLIIAHNPAALWPAYNLARKRKIPFAIDIEDYHPGEFVKAGKINSMESLMRKVLPSANYVSFASKAIKRLTIKKFDVPGKSLVIDNCFEQQEFLTPGTEMSGERIRFVWFSQNINFTRGLEIVIPVLQQFKDDIEITLIGNLHAEFASFLSPYSYFVKTIPPLPQTSLHHMLVNFDIGLAVEIPVSNVNRNICLTNKIWSYFQSGLFILATTTAAQEEFLQEHGRHGKLFDISNEQTLIESMSYILNNRELIRLRRIGRYNNALNYSWAKESQTLVREWKEIFVV